MSINELIATSSVHVFNSGVAAGRKLERERLVTLLADEKVAKDVSFHARHLTEEHPQQIIDNALIRLGQILD